jgi:adenylate kinase
MMRVILLGPPGSGKGTQAKLLCAKLGLAHFATGDILREAQNRGTQLGLQAAAYMNKGQYVPDELVNDLVAERLTAPNRPAAFVMDGYPRTLAQAEALDQLLHAQGLSIDAAVLLHVSDEVIVLRVSGRRICPKDGSQYHVLFDPPKKQPERCDRCGTPIVPRQDDPEGTVRERLRVFHQAMPPVIDYYRRRSILREVDGEGTIESISAALLCRLGVGQTC